MAGICLTAKLPPFSVLPSSVARRSQFRLRAPRREQVSPPRSFSEIGYATVERSGAKTLKWKNNPVGTGAGFVFAVRLTRTRSEVLPHRPARHVRRQCPFLTVLSASLLAFEMLLFLLLLLLFYLAAPLFDHTHGRQPVMPHRREARNATRCRCSLENVSRKPRKAKHEPVWPWALRSGGLCDTGELLAIPRWPLTPILSFTPYSLLLHLALRSPVRGHGVPTLVSAPLSRFHDFSLLDTHPLKRPPSRQFFPRDQ